MLPIIKWAGGKEKELRYILPYTPQGFVDYYEPFVGGGSVFVNMRARHYYINDFSDELFLLYDNIKHQDREFFRLLESIDETWSNASCFYELHKDTLLSVYQKYRTEAISQKEMERENGRFCSEHEARLKEMLCVPFDTEANAFVAEVQESLNNKMHRMLVLEKTRIPLPQSDISDNLHTAVKNAVYMYLRLLYNTKMADKKMHCALFFFIRNYAYSGMFRYNKQGAFNVPYGGMAYNGKTLRPKLDYYQGDDLGSLFGKTTVTNMDFEAFLAKHTPHPDDFVFLDPPYDSDFSTYAQNAFSREDHRRLASCIMNTLKCRWMMIIKSTPFILDLYAGQEGISIMSFDKKYQVSFMNRNNKDVTHLLIKNY